MIDNNSAITIGRDIKQWDLRSKDSKQLGNIQGNLVDFKMNENSLFLAEEGGSIFQFDFRSENQSISYVRFI